MIPSNFLPDDHFDEPVYSIEPHGKEGNFVLYFGRNSMRHGLNLCTLNDFDKNGEQTRKLIVDALNQFKEDT